MRLRREVDFRYRMVVDTFRDALERLLIVLSYSSELEGMAVLGTLAALVNAWEAMRPVTLSGSESARAAHETLGWLVCAEDAKRLLR